MSRGTPVAMLLAALLVSAGAGPLAVEEKTTMKKLTPVLFVEEIEPCVKFWVERLGFQKTAEVPEGSKLGFVILQKDDVQIMYQSYASVQKDVPSLAKEARKGPTFLYLEVENLDPIIEKLKGVEIVIPERKTFYGMREIGIREPGGHLVTFAAPVPGAAH